MVALLGVRSLVVVMMATAVMPKHCLSQGMRTGPVPERFSTFIFDGISGTVPDNWERGWAPSGDLRMRPPGNGDAWLDLALFKLHLNNEDAQGTAAQFLASLASANPPGSTLSEQSPTRAYVWYDRMTSESGKNLKARTWHLALKSPRDTLYILTATTSEWLPPDRSTFDSLLIANAERAVLGIRISRQ
jgi:hypothetical protein